MKKKYSAIEMLLRIVTAIILLQTLHFKFSGHPDAVYIFSSIGIEPWGRYGIGAIELITGLMFFLPNLWRYAAVITFGLMIGAMGSHLFTPVGVVVENNGNSDGGQLFGMAIIAFAFSSFLIYRSGFYKLLLNFLKSKFGYE